MISEELPPLSEREREVLKLVATGATNQQIARALVVSPNTVKVHLRNIFEKLGVQSRTEATTVAIRRGLVQVPVLVSAGAGTALPTAVSEGSVDGESPEAEPPVIDWLPERNERRRVAAWQRGYMIGVLMLVLFLAVAPTWLKARGQTPPEDLFSDLGRSQGTAPQRVEASRWSAGAAMPTGRSRLALSARAPLLYAIGGETSDGASDALTVYDPRENAWRAGPSKPTAVANVSAAVIGDLIFVPGGSTKSGVTDVLEIYDTSTEAWRTGAQLPSPLAAYALAAAGGRLYLMGGWDGTGYRSETHVYDPGSESWSAGPELPSRRAFHAGASLKDVVYVAGGFNGREELSEVLSYNPSAADEEGWTRRASMEQPRAGLGLAALGSRLYAVGGGWTETPTFNEQYDSQVDAWSHIGTPVAGHWRNPGVAALEQKVYAVGGWSGSPISMNEQYQALLRQLLPIGGRGG